MSQITRIPPDADVTRINSARQTNQTTPQKQEDTGIPKEKEYTVDVDKKAQEDARLEQNAKLLLDELPGSRADRVEQAKIRLAEGYYDNDSVIDQTAEKITRNPSLGPLFES